MASNTKTMSSVKEARELYELKERAAKFYSENGVPQKMEDVLNSMFYDNPSDVYGHLVYTYLYPLLKDIVFVIHISSNSDWITIDKD